MNWKRISLISAILAAISVTAALAMLVGPSLLRSRIYSAQPKRALIPRKDYSPRQNAAIQQAFWVDIKGKDRNCAEAYVHNYMASIRANCEASGAAANIGGGCAHIANPMNYPEVLEAGLHHCGITIKD